MRLLGATVAEGEVAIGFRGDRVFRRDRQIERIRHAGENIRPAANAFPFSARGTNPAPPAEQHEAELAIRGVAFDALA
jgi:hypothetical protein